MLAGSLGARLTAPSVRAARRAVGFVVTGLDFGGAERQVVGLALALRARGWTVSVTSLLPPRAFVDQLREREIAVHSLGMTRGRADPRAAWRLLRALRQERPDVVHAHMVHANLLARIVRPLAPAAVLVCTAHSVDEGGRARELAYRLTDRLGDVTTNVSRAGVERYVRVGAAPAARILLVPNGVDTTAFAPRPEVRARVRTALGVGERLVWLCVARMEAPKQHRELLAAFQRVHGGRGDALLLLAGDGPDRPALERMARELSLGAEVRFLGVRSDVHELMRAADALALPSAWEGLPMVLLEAAASGLPIVATDVGGIPEIVRPGESGILVPPSSVDRLADALRAVAALDAPARVRMGASGRALVEERFDIERVTDEWEALYARLLSAAAAGPSRG